MTLLHVQRRIRRLTPVKHAAALRHNFIRFSNGGRCEGLSHGLLMFCVEQPLGEGDAHVCVDGQIIKPRETRHCGQQLEDLGPRLKARMRRLNAGPFVVRHSFGAIPGK